MRFLLSLCVVELNVHKGSTKVFKTRPGCRAAGHPKGSAISANENATTKQITDVIVSSDSAVFLLPDPVTCFRSASYNQIQTFRLSSNTSSIVLLDWVTSGRKSLGEHWVFSRYYSVNEVWLDGKRLARDALLLEDLGEDTATAPARSLKDRLSPYSCYATLFLYGPIVQNVISDVNAEYAKISIFKTKAPAELIWSLSPISEGKGSIIRVAGKDTEGVKIWLGQALKRLEDIVGTDVYRRAFTR